MSSYQNFLNDFKTAATAANRDIEEINNIIIRRKNLGLRIDSEIFKEFEKKVKHKNIVFASNKSVFKSRPLAFATAIWT